MINREPFSYPKGGRQKLDFFADMFAVRGGGLDPHPLKKYTFIQKKCKKYSACPE